MANVFIKPIKAKVTLPNLAAITDKELMAEAKTVQREYKATTRTFKRVKPDFRIKRITTGVYAAGTDDRIYNYLDKGTRPHIIRAKRAKVLRFNSNFKSKTVPGRLNPRAGKNTGPAAFAKQVKHPGTKPRGFTRIIHERSKVRFSTNYQKAIARAMGK